MEGAATVVRPELASIVAEIFEYAGPLTPDLGPDQIPRWDSLQHIALVRTLEETFGIALTMDEMMEMRTLADIETVLHRHAR